MDTCEKFRKRERKILKDCGCICRCPHCCDILNDQAELVKDSERLTIYKCQCGCESQWDFSYPVPIILFWEGGKEMLPPKSLCRLAPPKKKWWSFL